MIHLSPGWDAALAAVLGLLIGSFLNVVVYRTPVMLYRAWLEDALASLAPATLGPTLWELVFGRQAHKPPQLESDVASATERLAALPALTLSQPRSRCGACAHPIAWYHNVPVLSYLLLRGRCAACGVGISIRYPLVEGLVAALFAVAGFRYGLTPIGALWAAFGSLLVCQFLIDLDTQLLPDHLNYLLLWLGLAGAALGWTGISLHTAVWGAIGGYLSLWLVYHLYRLATGKEGMGYGDFKLLAALGAWLGADYLLAIILVSSLVGAVLGLTLRVIGQIKDIDVPISFGPFLAGAGLVCFLAEPQTVRDWIPFAFPFNAR